MDAPVLALAASLALTGAAPKALRVCDDVSDPAVLDPYSAFDNKSDNILNAVYEGLVAVDSEGRIAPALALRWERLDALRTRFFLRPGVLFHDGSPADAGAVRDSFARLAASGAPAALQIEPVKEVVVESSSTVVVETSRPDGVLLHRLAAFGRVAGAGKPGQPPPGTGPYRFVEWIRGQSVELEKNAGYWGRAGAFARVLFYFLPEAEQVSRLTSGGLDMITDLPGMLTLQLSREGGLRIVKRQALSTHAFWFTSFRGPLADRRARRALNYAIDKAELVRYAAHGNGLPLATLSMPGEVGHNAELKPYAYDPPQAKALLKEAGWPADFRLRILAVSQSEREAGVIKGQLKRVGVESDVTLVSLAKAFEIVSRKQVGEYDIFANLAPDPVAHMYFLAGVCWYSRSPMSAGGFPGFDELYEKVLGTTDPTDHVKLAEKLDAFIHSEALGLFTYQRLKTYGLSSGLGFKPTLTGMLDLREVSWR